MVVCKYFQQGTCRFGQFCRFDHINNFGNSAARNKTYIDSKNIALIVAEEILASEQGGQWPLSCFGPFMERPCIPGMEDLSPEEVRWEMYQAQQNGTVEQMKLQFQELCQQMKNKKNIFKNPAQDLVSMLEKLHKGEQSTEFSSSPLAKSTNFSFATPQAGLPTSNVSASSPFASKPFNTSVNPFGGNFGTSTSTQFSFNSTAVNNPSSVFNANPAFGNSNHVFGNTSSANTIFGGANKNSTSIFGGAQNSQTFGAVIPQNTSIFGEANAQPVFGQPVTFGTSTQVTGPFSRAQPGQNITSVYGSGTTSSQSNTSLFGGAKTSSSTLFSTTTASQISNPVFGSATSVAGSPIGAASLFGQPKTTSAFGGAPVFSGAPSSFAPTPGGTIFGEQSTFGSTPVPTNNVFGGSNTAAPTFGSVGQSANNMTFESVAVSPSNIFGGSQANSTPFGSAVSTSNVTPFISSTSTTGTPFVTATGPFGSTSTTPFSRSVPFESTASGSSVNSFGGPFGTGTSITGFGNANAAASAFGSSSYNSTTSSPFTSTNTTTTTTTSNPFTSKLQQSSLSLVNEPGKCQIATFATPFTSGKSVFTSANAIIDEAVYTIEGQLTDDEKSMYLSNQFILGKIPRKPPTISLR